ncbi:MAG: radical SAM protein [Candidatus Zipacnadales bacterium]
MGVCPIATATDRREQGIAALMKRALWYWGWEDPRRTFLLLRLGRRLIGQRRLRERMAKSVNGPIPTVLAISPTMRCNYHCLGCYSQNRSSERELSTEELDALLGEAGAFGVSSIVLTGGEPLLRDDLVDLIERHQRMLFVLVTNGSLLTVQTPNDWLTAPILSHWSA